MVPCGTGLDPSPPLPAACGEMGADSVVDPILCQEDSRATTHPLGVSPLASYLFSPVSQTHILSYLPSTQVFVEVLIGGFVSSL